MGKSRIVTVALLGIVSVPASVFAAGDSPRSPAKTGYWPMEREQAARDALSFATEVIARIHEANQIAIRVGRMAEERAGAPALRRYGRLVATDRRVQDGQLLEYARHAGVTVGPAKYLTEAEHIRGAEKAASLGRLATLSGPAFDNELLGLATSDNQSAIELIDEARGEVADPELRIMLDKALPILNQHMTIVQALGRRAVGMTVSR